MRATEIPDLRTVTITRDIAEEEAADAYEALSEEIQELREEVVLLHMEIATLRRGVLEQLEQVKEALSAAQRSVAHRGEHPRARDQPRRESAQFDGSLGAEKRQHARRPGRLPSAIELHPDIGQIYLARSPPA